MRILLLNQFFWPDSAATSQLVTDLAGHLADSGHKVTAICGKSDYGSKLHSPRPDVRIVSLPVTRFARGRIARLASYLCFMALALWSSFRIERPDCVVTLTTPPLLCLIGTLLKKFRGCHHFIWEMDLYPEVVSDLGVIRASSWIARAIGAIADYSRRRADGIIALGECMRDRLEARNIPADRIHVAENWASSKEIFPMPFRPDNRLTVLYSGNLGLVHDIETISAAIQELRQDGRFQFIFAGGGSKRKHFDVMRQRGDFPNLWFRPYASRSQLAESLGDGDIGLVTQMEGCAGSVVPSKTYGLMAAGRPILFIGPKEATPARVIRKFQCGWHIDCGDVESLISLLRQLADTQELVRVAGERARAAFLEHYDLPIGVSRIIMGLESKREEAAEAVTANMRAAGV